MIHALSFMMSITGTHIYVSRANYSVCQPADISAAKRRSGPRKIWADEINTRPNFMQNFPKKMAEKGPNFLKCVSTQILGTICRLILIFSHYFVLKNLCINQLNEPFIQKMVCGRIFTSAAEFFGWSGRKPSLGAGNTGKLLLLTHLQECNRRKTALAKIC
jgi:hypothetical protein